MRYSISLLIFFSCNILVAQQLNYELNNSFAQSLERKTSEKNNKTHSSIKPITFANLYDSEEEKNTYETSFRKEKKRWLWRKLFQESFIVIDTGDFFLQIDPLANLEYAKYDTTTGYVNGRGMRVQGNIGEKFSFYSYFMENQAFLYNYQYDYVKKTGAIPGNARVKRFKDTGFDYAMASGYISYAPTKKINFQFGHGNHFIGEGYRSLLLSDNTFNYPHVKSNFLFANQKIQYTSIFASLQNLVRVDYYDSAENPFERKGASFHYLSFKPINRIEIGIFEGMIWQRYDSTGTKEPKIEHYNPIIGINTITQKLNTKNNGLIGVNFKFIPINHTTIYAQYLVDEKQKTGYQIGVKAIDILKIKNLFAQLEYNSLGLGVYQTNNKQNYFHYNQSLGTPVESNSQEVFGKLFYSNHGGFISIKTNYILKGDSEVQILNPEIGYMFNKTTNMNFSVGYFSRNETKYVTKSKSQFNYIYLKFSTSLKNQYWDF